MPTHAADPRQLGPSVWFAAMTSLSRSAILPATPVQSSGMRTLKSPFLTSVSTLSRIASSSLSARRADGGSIPHLSDLHRLSCVRAEVAGPPLPTELRESEEANSTLPPELTISIAARAIVLDCLESDGNLRRRLGQCAAGIQGPTPLMRSTE